jgi:hypothetical protein
LAEGSRSMGRQVGLQFETVEGVGSTDACWQVPLHLDGWCGVGRLSKLLITTDATKQHCKTCKRSAIAQQHLVRE